MPNQHPLPPAPAIDSPIEKQSTVGTNSKVGWAIALLPLAYLWFRLINNLRLEWTTNPQYSYGAVVPFLCLGLLMRRWLGVMESRKQKAEIGNQESGSQTIFQLSAFKISAFQLAAALAFLYLPTRLIEAATPEWRPIQWALGFEAIGLTLLAIYIGKGRGWLRQLAFPICFFFVAIPWPTPVEEPIIQSLTRINSSIVVELLGWADIPALQHGNLIEVSTGTVGVNEACSGIRSFQTSLMISLFFGEFYRMGGWRRLLLVPAGFILAMLFNVCRMTFLTTVAAQKGVGAIAEYHDPAGVTITIVCTLGLWALALLFNKKSAVKSQRSEVSGQKSEISEQETTVEELNQRNTNKFQLSAFPISAFDSKTSRLLPFSLTLLLWLCAVEAGSELWYRHLESHPVPSPKWSVVFPTDNPTLKTAPISADTEYLLRYDEAKQATWTDPDGSRWQAFYCNWFPGRVAGYLAKRHTPEICLPASGREMLSGPDLKMMNINGVALPVRSYVFGSQAGALYVFHCRWEAGVNEDAYVTHESGRFNLIRGVWKGRGKAGQKIVEIIVSGCDNHEQAQAGLMRHLQTLIHVEKPEPGRPRADLRPILRLVRA